MTQETAETLADAFHVEQKRVRELLDMYCSIPTGSFGVLMLTGVLHRADVAASSGDVVAMLHSFQELKGCQ